MTEILMRASHCASGRGAVMASFVRERACECAGRRRPYERSHQRATGYLRLSRARTFCYRVKRGLWQIDRSCVSCFRMAPNSRNLATRSTSQFSRVGVPIERAPS